MKKALAIDIGGTKIFNTIIDESGKILTEVEKSSTPKTAEEIQDTLKNIIKKYEKEVDVIAIATAGDVNLSNNAVIGSTGNLPKGYREIDFSKLSSKRVFLENDANAAAWAEYKLGASKNTTVSILLTLGTGVGGGIIINDKLLKGRDGSAGEVHFKMFIAGKFEKFYKKPNPQVITKSLNTFCSHRIDAIKAVEANIQKEKEAKEDEAIKQNAITYEEWAAIKKAKGEEVNIELIEDEKGNKLFRVKASKADTRLDSAYMIVKNTTNADFNTLCKLRECFIKKYDIDPYDLIKNLGNKKLREYEERRNSQGNH